MFNYNVDHQVNNKLKKTKNNRNISSLTQDP